MTAPPQCRQSVDGSKYHISYTLTSGAANNGKIIVDLTLRVVLVACRDISLHVCMS